MGVLVQQIFGICFVLCTFIFSCIPTFPIYEDSQLYEGSRCELAHGNGYGICAKLIECPSKMRELHQGEYNIADRCGFSDFNEIVCCDSVNITDREKLTTPDERRAEAACQEYSNEISATERTVSFHILGGVNAKRNEFPFMAALGFQAPAEEEVPGGIKYTCGGTLISRQHVLTAAHCVSNVDERVPVEVRLGSTDLTNADEDTQRVAVLSVIPHPNYKRSRNYNDIAIIKLKEPVRMTNSVQPACLMTRSLNDVDSSVNQTVVVLGWGVTDFEGSETTQLKKAAGLNLVELEDCSRSYKPSTRLPNSIDETMICAIDPNTTRRADTCWGDSGGPLLISAGSSSAVAGVTAFGQACGGTTPSVYTSVLDYLSWIEGHVWPDTKSKRSDTES
ncbi:serine protease persephone-like isoform X2 [Athalia rosae]|uniref:serine protease persephone-like isoform X2 n=1 Tax=Athalia rosae TaxID=37344 RepID=UPI0020343CC5|nr:serine protease persephone-like isoform X2 [Athalia rosae]